MRFKSTSLHKNVIPQSQYGLSLSLTLDPDTVVIIRQRGRPIIVRDSDGFVTKNNEVANPVPPLYPLNMRGGGGCHQQEPKNKGQEY